MASKGFVLVIGMFVQNPVTLAHAITLQEQLAISSGFTETACQGCEAPCLIGPAQREQYETTRGPIALLCHSCVLFGKDIVIMRRVDPHETAREAQ